MDHKTRPLVPRTRPSWYYRILALIESDVNSEKGFTSSRQRAGHRPTTTYLRDDVFDEDISDLDTRECQKTCQRCEDYIEPDDEVEEGEEIQESDAQDCDCCCHEEEISETGSDASYYEEIRLEREDRKEELLATKKLSRLRCAEERETQSEHQAAYDTAYKALLKAEKDQKAVPISLKDKSFILYSGDYVEHFFHENSPTKRLDLNTIEPEDKGLMCQVYLASGTSTMFELCDPPTLASSRPLKITTSEGRLEITIVSNKYLKLKASRDLVHANSVRESETLPDTVPAEFEFIGIWRTLKEQIEEGRRKRKRS
ncbi:hypothetical protein B0J13DRAFT_641101 [Dactylonectria estremocensis]|uniref:Uncharacterized protein n=1 Tax=Dactylonectria estremocensis TaxID=1079267 RepID=A0A9P9EBQ5_9HYPO|nr:hypothetical protein B0J13DRAFT_641101 [Dactylonectria estremocensis]